MKTTNPRALAVIAATALCASIGVAVPSLAVADEKATEASAAVVAEALQGVNESLLLEGTNEGSVGVVEAGGGTVTVPNTPSEGVTIGSSESESLTVELPGAGVADNAVVLDGGVVTYPAEAYSNSVIVSDSGVQMLTTIVDEAAPQRFAYGVTLAEGQSLRLADGGAAVFNADGSVAVSVATAWAVDANGAPVATHYEVEGSTLVQVVDHQSDAVAYPVVADPIWIAPWVYRCLLGLGLKGPQITNAFATGTIWGGLGAAALACALGR